MALTRINAVTVIILTCLALALGGCGQSSITDAETQQAAAALQAYFNALSQGRYAEAVELYGGSYETPQYFNPDVNPQEHEQLFELVCTVNGLQCLQVHEILQSKRLDADTFSFLITFTGRDGGVFVLGPCCGADETQMPPVSQFTYTVKRIDGQFKVMELPVYVP